MTENRLLLIGPDILLPNGVDKQSFVSKGKIWNRNVIITKYKYGRTESTYYDNGTFIELWHLLTMFLSLSPRMDF